MTPKDLSNRGITFDLPTLFPPTRDIVSSITLKSIVMKKYLPILWGILICLAVGAVSRLTHMAAMDFWYPFLNKAPLNPPDIVFPIVWGVLYVLMGISAGLLYGAEKSPARTKALRSFGIQLALNFTWNVLFFYLQNPLLGLINLVVLVVMAIWYFMDTLKIRRSAAWFFLPYTCWISFATYLNMYILLNN